VTESRQISWCHRIAVLLIVLGYFALAAVAPSCLWAASTSNPAAHHQHHGQEVAHSLLCVWACQAGSSPALLDVGGMSLALFLLLYAVTVVRVPFTQSGWAFARPRSPPLLIG
jgi:hypothetical protein